MITNLLSDHATEILWFTITGDDYGTGITFEGDQFGLTHDDRVLDSDGAPLTEGDHLEIAVRNIIRKYPATFNV